MAKFHYLAASKNVESEKIEDRTVTLFGPFQRRGFAVSFAHANADEFKGFQLSVIAAGGMNIVPLRSEVPEEVEDEEEKEEAPKEEKPKAASKGKYKAPPKSDA